MADERWRPIRSWEGLYEVSDQGRVRRSGGTGRGPFPRVLAPGKWGYGYQHVHFSDMGRKKDYSVHRLVADAFLGPLPADKQVNHKDGDKNNNRVENLEIVSARENYDHAKRERLYHTGPRPERSKLTESDVLAIRSMKGHIKPQYLAEAFGVHRVTISAIWRRAACRHIPESEWVWP